MCSKHNLNYSNVMLYLKLRDSGCEKDDARRFCSKNFCKIDQTQQSIGPPGHKILKLVPDRLLGEKGWQPGFMMKYNLGSGFQDSKDLVEQPTQAEKAILKQYDKYEKKKNAALLQKMLAVKQYADSLKPPPINPFTKQGIERIRKISQELRESQQHPKRFFQVGDVKFYSLVDYIEQQRSESVSDLKFHFDSLADSKVKFKTESQQYITQTKLLRKQGTMSSMEKDADFIMSLQHNTPINEHLNSEESSPIRKLVHHKFDLAEEFNSTQYLFSPSESHTRQPSQIDQEDTAVKCFVQKYYEKQYTEKNDQPKRKNIRLRAIANSDTKRIKQSIKQKTTN